MKILQIIFSLSPGGAERFVVDLSNELSKNNDVTLLTLKDFTNNPEGNFYKFDLSPRVKYENLGLSQKYSPIGLWKVYQYIKRCKPDVVHMHLGGMPKFCAFANLVLGRKITFVQTIHNDMRNGYKNFMYDVLHATLGRCKMIRFVALSETNYKDLCSIYPHSTATCITNGRAPLKKSEKFENVVEEINGYKKDKDTKVILHVARCHAQKNQDLLIDGFNQTVAEGRNVILLIIGLGYDSERGFELKEKACGSVYFLGTRTNIGDYMLNADVFTLSSLAEGMPITLLEAMLCGVPMVSTPVCGAVDVINGKNGLLSKDFSKAEYCKALEKVIDDNEYYKQNAKADMSESEYTIKKCAEKYMEFYRLKV